MVWKRITTNLRWSLIQHETQADGGSGSKGVVQKGRLDKEITLWKLITCQAGYCLKGEGYYGQKPPENLVN